MLIIHHIYLNYCFLLFSEENGQNVKMPVDRGFINHLLNPNFSSSNPFLGGYVKVK